MAVSKKNINKRKKKALLEALAFDPIRASKIIAEEIKKKGFIVSDTTSRAPKRPKPNKPIVNPAEEIKPKPIPIIMPSRNRRNRAAAGSKKPGKGGSATGIKVSEEDKLVIVGKH